MKYAYILLISLLILSVINSCSWGNLPKANDTSGETSPISVDEELNLGANINSGYSIPTIDCNGKTEGQFALDGFSISIPTGSLNPCTNANPVVAKTSTLPTDLKLNTNDSNITAGDKAYNLNMGKDYTRHSVFTPLTVILPFDSTNIPLAKKDNTHIFVMIFDKTTGLSIPVHGTLSDNNITISLWGLGQDQTFVVIYNPNMTGVGNVANPIKKKSTQTDKYAQFQVSEVNVLATPSTWSALDFCVIYDPTAASLVAEVQKAVGHIPSANEISSTVQTKVANAAKKAATAYKNANLRTPFLATYNSASDPCGATMTTTPRYSLHLIESSPYGDHSVASSPQEPMSSEGFHFGAINILYKTMNDVQGVNSISPYNTIAHELFHSIQDGYSVWNGDTTMGYREGSATFVGETLQARESDTSIKAKVRSLDPGETFKLSNFLMVNGGWKSYSNQDFFVYVSKQYCTEFLWIGSLFESLSTNIQDYMNNNATNQNFKFAPYRFVLRNSMNAFFEGNCGGLGLKQIYLDFIRQRAFEHNANSQFSRTGETTSGFAKDLFGDTQAQINGSVVDLNWDPNVPQKVKKGFANLMPFATRAIRILPTMKRGDQTLNDLIFSFTDPANLDFGTNVVGTVYRKGVKGDLTSEATFKDFGQTADDEIVILISNVSENNSYSFSFNIEIKAPEPTPTPGNCYMNLTFKGNIPASNPNTFKLSQNKPVPGMVWLDFSASSGGSTPSFGLTLITMTGGITKTGTYDIGVTDSCGTACATYAYSNTQTWQSIPGEGPGPTPKRSSITITEFGKNVGERMSGSFSINMSPNYFGSEKDGPIEGTFSCTVSD